MWNESISKEQSGTERAEKERNNKKILQTNEQTNKQQQQRKECHKSFWYFNI